MNTVFSKSLRFSMILGSVLILLLCGLPLGNFLGGVLGLKIAGAVSGTPLESGPFPRALVFGGMIAGLLLTTGSFLLLAAVARRVFLSKNSATS